VYAVYVRDKDGVAWDKFKDDLISLGGVSKTRASAVVAIIKFLGVCPVETGEYEPLLDICERLTAGGYDAWVTFPDSPKNELVPNTPFARWCDGITTADEFDKEWAIWGRESVPENCR